MKERVESKRQKFGRRKERPESATGMIEPKFLARPGTALA
jgi:hypothetical protein